jgi:hypothetical protein
LGSRCQLSGSRYQDHHNALSDNTSYEQVQDSQACIVGEMKIVNNKYNWYFFGQRFKQLLE